MAALFLAASSAAIAEAREPLGEIRLRAYGGLSGLGGGDFNSGQRGWADFYCAVFGLLSYVPDGDIKPVRMGWDLGSEAIYKFSSSLGVGFGAGFLRAARTSDMAFTPSRAGLDVLKYEAGTVLSAVPLTVSLHYFLPSKGRIGIGAQAGLGPTLAWGCASQRLSDGAGNWTLNEYRVRGGGLGFLAGLGLEYELSGRLALFLEARGRLAAFTNFKGDVAVSDSTGWSDSASGLLWSERVDLGSLGSWNIFEISETEPAGTGLAEVRRARIDFSGISLVLGVVFKL